LLVDRVTELVPGQRIVGIKNFTGNEDTTLGGDQSPAINYQSCILSGR